MFPNGCAMTLLSSCQSAWDALGLQPDKRRLITFRSTISTYQATHFLPKCHDERFSQLCILERSTLHRRADFFRCVGQIGGGEDLRDLGLGQEFAGTVDVSA